MEDRSLYIGRVMVLLFHRLGFAVLDEYEVKIFFALSAPFPRVYRSGGKAV